MRPKIENKILTTRRFVDRELRERGVIPRIPHREIAAALSIAEEGGHTLRHYVVIRLDRTPTLYNIYRLGFGQPLLHGCWMRHEEVAGRLTALIRSLLADTIRDYEVKRPIIEDLRWLRSDLLRGPGADEKVSAGRHPEPKRIGSRETE